MNMPGPSAAQEKLLTALSPGLRQLALRGTLRNYRKHAVIVNEGEIGDSLFVLLQGRVKVFSNDADGREITYNVVEAGDYFGEMWLDGGPRSASVMTLEPCTCSVVGRSALREHLAEEPEFALDLVAQVIRRARAATETARNMALLDVYGRVIVTLESTQGPAKPGEPIVLTQITHQNIASRVGASREMVSRLLKDLEKGGYIELGVKRITLLKKLPARW
ncbi:Crp/Fnr family transcriptional regulator [Caenimonas koreensis]|uniref:Cyclic nucleotide-binding domain-containing protein n=1 Tax=Caenimonas koreensis DSM 17982 TaxID=1121255 RepID=A0A844B8N5_9BURK|nr:Crp/Fnr family transcriptional regulator [Caenimonas koreensis]MRD49512.1 cyclic nucleotide-binding domain-containing protein [Caenimonas koreensis DSM 17982]